jgi:Na+/H+ antiporter NhaC
MKARKVKVSRLRMLLCAIVVLAGTLVPLAIFAAEEGEEEYVPLVYGQWWALLPPIIAIACALITKEVYSSLFFGILTGGILYAAGSSGAGIEVFRNTFTHVFEDGFLATVTDSWNMAILIFATVTGIFVVLVNRSGATEAFGRWAEVNIKSRVGAQIVTIVLGGLIFLDDYFNCLSVGAAMRPVTDRHKVSRAKLAYLLDSTAAPVCIIAPISTWAAAVASFAQDAHAENGFMLFVQAIPYNFYALLTIFFMVMLVLMKTDYGPMRKHEINAINGDIYTTPERPFAGAEEEAANPRGRVYDLILPLIFLIVACILGLLWSGGFFSGDNGFIDAFANSDASIGLMTGSLFGLFAMIIYFLCRRLLSFKAIMQCVPDGWKVMAAGELVLIFAWTINSMTGSVGAADFVAEQMSGAAGGLMNLLPAIIFLVACGLAFATGTSWGTFGILIPIVIAVLANVDPQLTIIGMSACMAGGVFGDHCSPISDTTVLASTGSQIYHINHVATQLPYALTVGAITFIGFLIAGFVRTPLVSIAVGVVLIIIILYFIRKKNGTNEEAAAKALAGGSAETA